MKVDQQALVKVISALTKTSYLAIAFLSFAVPIALLYGATKFVFAPVEALIFFGFVGFSSLIYSAWVISRIEITKNTN